jgi:hypothetical protein
MLIVAAAVALTIAAPAQPMPPMIVSITAAPDIPTALVARVTTETDAIWRSTGITFIWQDAARDRAAAARRGAPSFGRPTLRLVIGNEPGVTREGGFALGWIVFEDGQPVQEIYLSYRNAIKLLRESDGVVGHVSMMPQLQREILLARAMGRALAHEIGHYLSGSKLHTPRGLMVAAHTAAELFGQERNRFGITPAEQQRMVARFTSISIASRG